MNPRPPDRRSGSTVSQLRDDIDRGRTGDKVPGEDPAAAPLGTDDEAAGAAPSPEAVDLDRRTARAARPKTHHEADGEAPVPRAGRRVLYAILVLVAIAVVAILVAFLPL